MQFQINHTMVIAAEHPDGSQEWACPTCGRRLLMKWPPNHSRAIIEEGDTTAVHMGEVSEMNRQPGDDTTSESGDRYLAPFIDWIENYER